MAMLASISPLMIILLYFWRLPSPCLFGIGVARRTSLLSTKLVHTCGCMYKARKNKSNIIQRKKKQTHDSLASPSGATASDAREMSIPPSSQVAALISQQAPCIFNIRFFADGMLVAALVAEFRWHSVECPDMDVQAASSLHISSSSILAALASASSCSSSSFPSSLSRSLG